MNEHRKQMQKEWELNSKRYNDPIGMTGRRPVSEEFEDTVRDVSSKIALKNQGIRNFLDAGCSNGYLMKHLDPDVNLIVGIDFCFEPLLEGRKLNSNARYVQGEITNLPFPNCYFDRILCYSLFHYLPSLEIVYQASSELFRVLSRNGRLMIGDLLSEDHKHLIPKSDRVRWNSYERPFMHRLDNWTFVSLALLKQHFLGKRARLVEITPQIRDTRENSYRFDLIVEK
ncbi:class I SAM-dependent methyltransferase [bacterium]|nr:class I SAM-dependent methyltransferase [bacterium]